MNCNTEMIKIAHLKKNDNDKELKQLTNLKSKDDKTKNATKELEELKQDNKKLKELCHKTLTLVKQQADEVAAKDLKIAHQAAESLANDAMTENMIEDQDETLKLAVDEEKKAKETFEKMNRAAEQQLKDKEIV